MNYEYRQENILLSEIAECMNVRTAEDGAEFVAVVPDPTEYASGEPHVVLVYKVPVESDLTKETLRDQFY